MTKIEVLVFDTLESADEMADSKIDENISTFVKGRNNGNDFEGLEFYALVHLYAHERGYGYSGNIHYQSDEFKGDMCTNLTDLVWYVMWDLATHTIKYKNMHPGVRLKPIFYTVKKQDMMYQLRDFAASARERHQEKYGGESPGLDALHDVFDTMFERSLTDEEREEFVRLYNA